MRKREKHSYYPDIFEPAPLWRGPITQSNNTSINTYAHSPTHRSPIHHQPSLNDLLYDFNSHASRQQEGNNSLTWRSVPFLYSLYIRILKCV